MFHRSLAADRFDLRAGSAEAAISPVGHGALAGDVRGCAILALSGVESGGTRSNCSYHDAGGLGVAFRCSAAKSAGQVFCRAPSYSNLALRMLCIVFSYFTTSFSSSFPCARLLKSSS
ncbi:hypothetical protein D3C78_822180 [compost metagenome]